MLDELDVEFIRKYLTCLNSSLGSKPLIRIWPSQLRAPEVGRGPIVEPGGGDKTS